jgi:galactose dehydrogenase
MRDIELTQIEANYPDLSTASVFITGGGSGIGAAITEAFLRQGSRVCFVQRSNAYEFCDRLSHETGNRPMFVQCDVTDTAALERAVKQAESAHGSIRILVNNAANDERHDTEATSPEVWDQLIAINLKAYFFATRAVVGGMKKAGGGSIINFSSISYLMGNAGYPVYVAANSGINGLTRAHAREFGPDRIRVNSLIPGWVMTEKQVDKWATAEALDAHLSRQCLKEKLAPEDIAGGALFLASEASRMMTGQAMVIDGGVVVTG